MQRKKRPQFSEGTFAFAAPVTGPIPHILGAMLEWQSTGEDPEALSALTRALIQCVQFLAPPRQVRNCKHTLFESICAHLEENYDQDVTRDAVAQLFHISPGHLSQLFRRYAKMRFVDYLTNIRISRGKYLLRTERFKLDDIASRVGFCDAAYFCRLFKKFTQTTPAEYRAKALRLPNHLRVGNDLRTPSAVRESMRGNNPWHSPVPSAR